MPPFAISVPLILELTTLFRTILLLLSASLPKDVMNGNIPTDTGITMFLYLPSLPPEHQPEKIPCCRTGNKQLHRKSHHKISAVSNQIIRDELICKSIAMVYTKNTRQRHLGYYRKNLNCKNNDDWPVCLPDDPESEIFRHTA